MSWQENLFFLAWLALMGVVQDELCTLSLVVDSELDSLPLFEVDGTLIGRSVHFFNIAEISSCYDPANCAGMRHTKNNLLVSLTSKSEG